jgi:hypothetical protein
MFETIKQFFQDPVERLEEDLFLPMLKYATEEEEQKRMATIVDMGDTVSRDFPQEEEI